MFCRGIPLVCTKQLGIRLLNLLESLQSVVTGPHTGIVLFLIRRGKHDVRRYRNRGFDLVRGMTVLRMHAQHHHVFIADVAQNRPCASASRLASAAPERAAEQRLLRSDSPIFSR